MEDPLKTVPADRIYWLASYPKSGNTWIRLLVSAYSTGTCDINAILCSRTDTSDYAYQRVAHKPFSKLHYDEWAALAPAAAFHIPMCAAERPLFIKTHHALNKPFGHSVVPPGIGKAAVLLVRDPRDVAISLANHLNKSVDEAIDVMNDDSTILAKEGTAPQFICSWSQHFVSWTRKDPLGDCPIHVVRYEDLYANPRAALEQILNIIGETPVNKEHVKRAVSMTKMQKLQDQEKKKRFREASNEAKFFRRGGSYWREVLTPEQIYRIESKNDFVMKALGYETSVVVAA